MLASTGHVQRALALTRASHAQPHGMIGVVHVHAVVYLMANDDVRARECLDLIVAMGAPPYLGQLAKLFSHAAQREGRHDEAIRLMTLNLASPLQGTGIEAVVEHVFGSLATGEDTGAAVDVIDRLLEKVPLARLPHYLRFHILEWYAQLGTLEKAYFFGHALIDHLDRQGTVGMTWVTPWLREMREFRLDPRFEAFVARLGLPDYWDRYGPPD